MASWGTTPGLNFIYRAHESHVISARRIWTRSTSACPGPWRIPEWAGQHVSSKSTYSEIYPHISQNEEGLRRLFKQFSFPGGIPSHAAPETPGSINEGGELGYSLLHAYGAVFDNPDLIACCVVGDGEAETGPCAASWHSNKFLNPARDGAVLPILHLNGYKIAGPTVLARIPQDELESLFRGYGYHCQTSSDVHEGTNHELAHQTMAAVLDKSIAEIQRQFSPGSPHFPALPNDAPGR